MTVLWKQQKDRDQKRQYDQQYWQRLKADPERYKHWLGGGGILPTYSLPYSADFSAFGRQYQGKDSGRSSRYKQEHWLKLKQDPQRYERWKMTMREVNRKSRLRRKMRQLESSQQ
ncbi:hypothetical protein ACOMHN_022957 [Nucella lapillus]